MDKHDIMKVFGLRYCGKLPPESVWAAGKIIPFLMRKKFNIPISRIDEVICSAYGDWRRWKWGNVNLFVYKRVPDDAMGNEIWQPAAA